MKHFAVAILFVSIGSVASAACPDLHAGFHQNRSEQNYDGTCTIFVPKVSDRGVHKYVIGDIDKVCEAFGFGVKSGVDGSERILFGGDEVIPFDGPIYKAKSGVSYGSITCRMSNIK